MLGVIVLALGVLAWLLMRRQPCLLPRGKCVLARTIAHQQRRYYVEEVAFANRQQAIHGYFRLVPALLAHGEVRESTYDFFDFYTVALRFDDCSMKLVRRLNNVRLIKSMEPLPLEEFERQIAAIAYREM